MDPSEPHWQMNSSFSPPLSRRWDCRFQSDGLSHRVHEAPIYGSSLSSHSKGSRSGVSSDQYPNHYHSVSDGALSYLGSPSDNLQVPGWTPPVRRYDLGEFTPVGGARLETSVFSRSNERHFGALNNYGSASPLPDSSRWASTSKQPNFFPPRNFSGRRSFMSKPVYPLVFRNPVSDAEAFGMAETSSGGRMTPGDDVRTFPIWPENILSPDLKFRKTITELQKTEASPEPNTSSRREGFRWSNASSYDFAYDGDVIDITDHIIVENQRCLNNSPRYQKCGLCERLLWQKSPWSSNRIVRSSDMPVAGVLPCHHVFHADCLEETTPKSQIHEPPCPLCLKTVGSEGSTSFSEPLQVALRSIRRSQGMNIPSNGGGNSSQSGGDLRRNQSLPRSRHGGSLTRSHFKKRFSFKGRMGKDLFGTKIFRRTGSSSSSLPKDDPNQARNGRSHQSSG
ncbi:uncharacterized protein LOC103702211 [Phoenix dactylifera]|uniref:Uncharacterized protein LOC103702211 n=1 Tax=Phoenix dactylifera TaxID=42345 RepID=A0A8B9A182_PHODC|nr:uncharacterized protein LOC103702211 [Phoenix dactylifera]XP_038980346.1 uncharacterized protein LOC103702211 [Phoenix dactylifera]